MLKFSKHNFLKEFFFLWRKIKHLLEYLGVFCVKMEISKLNNYLAETQQTSYWTMISYYELPDGNQKEPKRNPKFSWNLR
jgi:hypothetical protein